jgi:hypothetical protein
MNGSFVDGTIVSKNSLPDFSDTSLFNFSHHTFEGNDVQFMLSPLWSSCSEHHTICDCLDISSNCGWCSMVEECMESRFDTF